LSELDVGLVTSVGLSLDPGKWYIRVRAYNVYGESPSSNEVNVNITGPLPVNCVMSPWALARYGDWYLPCRQTVKTSDPVADGFQTRSEAWTRTIITPPLNGGTTCGSVTQTRTGTRACVYVAPFPVCVTTALTVTVNKWAVPLVYTASQPIATAEVLLNANKTISHGVFTDTRGCILTKSRF